jgi:hypothetical protein
MSFIKYAAVQLQQLSLKRAAPPPPPPEKQLPAIKGEKVGVYQRDGEYSRDPTFGDFVPILTETSMQDITVARSREILMAIAITRKILQCYCLHRLVVHCTISINKSDPPT